MTQPAAAEGPDAAPRQVFEEALRDSAAGWNTGDLDRFMAIYEDSPDTVYIGSRGPVHGFAAIRAVYAPRFGGPAGAAGRLGVDLLEVRALGPDYALVVGRYHLQPPAAGAAEASGLFTLTFHRLQGRWHVICDHSS